MIVEVWSKDNSFNSLILHHFEHSKRRSKISGTVIKPGKYISEQDGDKKEMTFYYQDQLPESYANSDDVLWEPGKMYTYYIQIQPSTAAITVKVTDWDSYFVGVDDLIFGE